MSNTNTVPSAEEILKEHQKVVAVKYHLGTTLVIGHRPTYYNEASISAMHEHTRLHLEAMRDSFCKEEYLDVDRNNIREAVNTYIKNNKL